MEDFGQLIAIIVGIIFLVINSLGKKKKPVATPPQRSSSKPSVPQTKTGIPELDVLLEEFSRQEDEIEEFEQVSQPAYETLETIEPNSPYAAYNSLNFEDQATNYEKLGEKTDRVLAHNIDEETNKESKELTNNFNFNLRDAVLFSEILKRPSY
jgi:hypothetical protein